MSNQSRAELEAELARLKAEQEILKAALKDQPRTLSCKVSEKGAVSVYGMGRFPVTLYATQWAKISEFMPQVQEFIKANDSKLAKKEQAIQA